MRISLPGWAAHWRRRSSRDHLASGELHARPIINPSLSRRLSLGYRRDYASNRLFEAMKRLILTLIEQEVQSAYGLAWFLFGAG